MRAVRVHEFGDPDVLQVEEVPQPEPVPGEVLVRVQAAGVNPYETYVREGRYTELPALPYTPGGDGAGVRTDTGERVYVTGSLSGTYAEYALCLEEDVRPLPDGLSYAQGAAVGVPYYTAYRALVQRAAAVAGERVLIHGASGGVGIATVQLGARRRPRRHGHGRQRGRKRAGRRPGRRARAGPSRPRPLRRRRSSSPAAGASTSSSSSSPTRTSAKDLKALAKRGRVVVVGSRGAVEVDARDLMNAEGAILGMRTPNARRDEEVGRARRRGRRAAERRAQARGRPRAAARGGPTGPSPDHGAARTGQAGARPLTRRRRRDLLARRRHPLHARQPGLAAAAREIRRHLGGVDGQRRGTAARRTPRAAPPASRAAVRRSPGSCSLKQRTNTRAPGAVAAASEAT